MSITASQRDEILSFNDGSPLIITSHEGSDGNELFNVIAFVRTISSPAPKYISSVSLLLSFPDEFPTKSPTVQLSQCQLFHPNFTDDGLWLDAKLENNESLSEYLMRLIRILQYKKIDSENIANRNAMAWYNAQIGSGTFPTDPINYSTKPRISIYKINEGLQPDRIQPILIGAIHYE